MSKPINIYEAKTRLSELVERAASGEEIILAKAGTPRARPRRAMRAATRLQRRLFLFRFRRRTERARRVYEQRTPGATKAVSR